MIYFLFWIQESIKLKNTGWASKGLEANNVILINLTDNILGFPSKIKGERILKYITKYDKYPFSEERRLFYVALTRTKNKVFLFTPIKGESVFIKELKRDYKIKCKKL